MADRAHSSSARADSLRQLALAAMAGSAPAFENLHRRLAGGIAQFFERRLGVGNDLVEDLAQRTWTEIYRALRDGRYDPERSQFSTYAYAVAHHVWLRHRRLRGAVASIPATEELDKLFETASRDGRTPEQVLHAAELIDAVRSCVESRGTPNSLTDGEREVALGVSRGESERDLSHRLGLAASTVHVRKLAALEKLRRCLRAKGFGELGGERGGRLGE
jgi:RNA polymerase sigma factor (sigma-70 family)